MIPAGFSMRATSFYRVFEQQQGTAASPTNQQAAVQERLTKQVALSVFKRWKEINIKM